MRKRHLDHRQVVVVVRAYHTGGDHLFFAEQLDMYLRRAVYHVFIGQNIAAFVKNKPRTNVYRPRLQVRGVEHWQIKGKRQGLRALAFGLRHLNIDDRILIAVDDADHIQLPVRTHHWLTTTHTPCAQALFLLITQQNHPPRKIRIPHHIRRGWSKATTNVY